jgi:carboxyl-terminal processing protease
MSDCHVVLEVGQNMRRIVIIPLLACVLFGAIPGVFAQEVQPPKTEEDNGYSQIAIFAKALELVRQDYVDENKTSYHDLVTAAMKGMLSSLDPHSQFMDPNDFRDMQDDTRSRFNGLGIEVSMKNGLPTVVTAMEDTPAAKAEFFPATKSCGSMACRRREWISRTRSMFCAGPQGAKVSMTLLRPSTKEIKEYTLQRAEIKIQSVKGERLLPPELTGPFRIGYIRLIQFNEPTADELSKAIDNLQKQGMQALILDLEIIRAGY